MTSFAMASETEFYVQVLQHLDADLAGVRAVLLEVTILRPEQHPRAADRLPNRIEINERRGDAGFHGDAVHAFRHRACELYRGRAVRVHLPVSGDKGGAGHR